MKVMELVVLKKYTNHILHIILKNQEKSQKFQLEASENASYLGIGNKAYCRSNATYEWL